MSGSIIEVERYHDISCGHRVAGHESKCAHLHGHNYRVHFICHAAKLDSVGRVLDFSAIKERLCFWLEENWDHKFLAWTNDRLMRNIQYVLDEHACAEETTEFGLSVVWVPFNPTAENMADHLLRVVAPAQLHGTGVTCLRVVIWETRKCAASAEL